MIKLLEKLAINKDKEYLADKLSVFCDLDKDDLKNSVSFLKKHIKEVRVYDFEELALYQQEAELDSYIYTCHLPLDDEIVLHKTLSNWAFENNFNQANPYNKIAKLFDDKYLFYILMIANEINQAYSLLLARGKLTYLEEEDHQLSNYPKLFIKPRKGTEKIDAKAIDYLSVTKFLNDGLSFDILDKIHKYDDAIIQEYINIENEYKFLYLFGKVFVDKELPASDETNKIQLEILEFVEIVSEYSKKHKIDMPEIFSIDLIQTQDKKIIINEANIRPNALFRFKYELS